MPINVPLTTGVADQTVEMNLDDQNCIIRVLYNRIDETFYLELTVDNVILLDLKKILVNQMLLHRHRALAINRFKGDFVLYTVDNPDNIVYNKNRLNIDYKLFYISESEVVDATNTSQLIN